MCRRYLQCWRFFFLLLFLTHMACQRLLWDVRPYALLWVFLVLWSICWSSLFHFKNGPKDFSSWTVRVFISLMRFLLYSLVSSSFFVLLRYTFWLDFLHFCLFDGFRFQYSEVLVSFLFSKCSDYFLIWSFYFFRRLPFSAFHNLHNVFFFLKFHPYIVIVYPHCLYSVLWSRWKPLNNRLI